MQVSRNNCASSGEIFSTEGHPVAHPEIFVENPGPGSDVAMMEFKQTALPGSVVRRVQHNESLLDDDPGLLHKRVTLHLRNARGIDYERANTILLIERTDNDMFKFNYQDLECSDEEPIWDFSDQDLSNFIFTGNLYQKSIFFNTNLTNADLRNMVMKYVVFTSVVLDNTKFPANILEPNVLADDESRRVVIEQLAKTYREQAGYFSLNRHVLFRSGMNIIQTLRNRALINDEGASAKTLAIHGLTFR